MSAVMTHPLGQASFQWQPGSTLVGTSSSQHPGLNPASKTISSGMHALDDVLPDGGWRRDSITEILSATDNDTALNLVLPALATLSQENKWLAWIGPPQFLDRYKLANAGVDTSRVLLVHPRTSANGLWLVEQALRTGTCGAVLSWMTGGDAGIDKNTGIFSRLQQAAEAGGTLGFVFRDEVYANQASPAITRLVLKKHLQKIQLEVLKDSNAKLAVPRVLKFSANRLSRQNRINQARH